MKSITKEKLLKKPYKEQQTERERGKKRFLERIVEEEEAKKDIEDYKINSPYRQEHERADDDKPI